MKTTYHVYRDRRGSKPEVTKTSNVLIRAQDELKFQELVKALQIESGEIKEAV